jgi:small subunit ribosomal protein S9
MAQVKHQYATGRRKSSSARIFLTPAEEGAAEVTVNGKTLQEYFGNTGQDQLAVRPLLVSEKKDAYSARITVRGGGLSGQAQAIGHGLARVLQSVEPELRPVLKKEGLLKRDPRVVERKKPGRHKARKKPQFSKR